MAEYRGYSKSPLVDMTSSDQEGDTFDPGYNRLKIYDVELEEWSPVNRELRRYGMNTVTLSHPSRIDTSNDVVVLDTLTAKSLRHTLLTLVQDCEHRQNLVQDLIVNNNQLKEELNLSNETNERIDSKAHDLKRMLENAQYRIKELEDDALVYSQKVEDEEERLKNTKDAAASRSRHLEHRSSTQEDEIQRLKTKISKLNEEEERRMLRQHEVFDRLKNRAARSSNISDEKILDIIDSYETQLHQLRQELDLYQDEGNVAQQKSYSPEPAVRDASANYKGLIKSYDKELRNAKRKVKELEEKNELLKMELDSRPMMKDFRDLQLKCKKYSRTLQRHHIQPTDAPEKQGPAKNLRKYSTYTEDIDYLPLDHCRRHLKHVCHLLAVEDITHIPDLVQHQQKALETLPKMEEFCHEVLDLVNESAASRASGHAVWCEKTWTPVIPALQLWKQQINDIQELRQSVSRLAQRLAPWKQYRFSQSCNVSDLISALDYLCSDNLDHDKCSTENPSMKTLDEIVKHFMTLFDVSRLAGVYPKMNYIYSRLGEVHNVMRTLKQLLGLEDESNAVSVVDAVGSLCQDRSRGTSTHYRDVLRDQDLDQVCQKIELHDEFFPVFERIVNQLMVILEVKRMEQLVPAVRALKLLTG